MKIHIAKSAQSSSWKQFDVDWYDFISTRLYVPTRTGETFEIYKSLSKEEKSVYKDCGGYIFGTLAKDSRAKQNVISRNALLLDVDFAPYDFWNTVLSTYSGLEIVMHTTHSHAPETPRFRMVVPLDRECTPDEYECIARIFASYLNIASFDKTTFQRNRLMYFPSVAADGEWLFYYNAGTFLSCDAVLSTLADWRDMTTWPFHPDEKVHAGTGKQRTHPHEANSVIGAFNRKYTVQETIATFLPELYISGYNDRYTYTKGSSALGAIVYDNVWFYSHHSTDPAQGRLLNAFELVACHLFEDDLNKCVKHFSSDPEIRKAMMLEAFEDLGEIEGNALKPADTEDITWYGKIELNKEGKPVASDRNLNMIFDNDPMLKGVFRYNEFTSNITLLTNPAWRKVDADTGDTIRNIDYPNLHKYIGLKYDISNMRMIDETLIHIAYRERYHPIRSYLSSLEWDGVPRLETALIDYFAAADNAYTREVMSKTLIGAVRRAFEYGSKHDTVTVLVGLEGSCKSIFWQRLGKMWYSDTFDMHNDKALYEQLQGKWIIEIAEFDKLSRAEVGQVKSFISKACDSFRPAFGHVVEDFFRQNIFVASTNEDAFLKSETGNRRFWPVRVHNGMYERGLHRSKYYVYNDFTQYVVDQFWAEAFYRYLSGESNILSPEATYIADDSRTEFEETNVLTGDVDAKLMQLVPEKYYSMTTEEVAGWWRFTAVREGDMVGVCKLDGISGIEIWCEILGRSKESYQRINQLEMLSAIRKSKVIDANDSKVVLTARHGRQRVYKIKTE